MAGFDVFLSSNLLFLCKRVTPQLLHICMSAMDDREVIANY